MKKLNLSLPKLQSPVNKALSIILIVSVVAAVAALAYVVTTPEVEVGDTDFYLLGEEGMAENYPKEMAIGEEGRVIVGVVNREYETVSYRVEVTIDGVRNNEVGPLVLEDGEIWEEIVSFTLDKLGDDQKVEFFLYKNGQSEPYGKPLHLWVDVKY